MSASQQNVNGWVRRLLGALAALLVMLGGAQVSAAQGDADAAGEPPAGDAASGTPAAPVQFSELVRLGLLMMDSKPPTPPVTQAPAVPDPSPWTSDYRTGPKGESPVVTPPPALGPGDGTVYAIGDSVLLGTERWLGQVLGGWDLRLDAKVGRRFPEGLDILRDNQASIGQVVVICLGHNYGGGGFSTGYIDDVMALTAKAQRVVFITQTEWSPPQVEVNRAIWAAAARYPKIVVAPWAETIKANPDMLWDHVHPNASGAVALSNLVAIMVGPVPSLSGFAPPRPVILPIPVDTTPVVTGTSTTRLGSGSTTSVSTSTTVPDSTTTTSSEPPSTSTSSTTSSEPPAP